MMTALQHQETLDKTTKVVGESHATQSYPSRTIVHAMLEMTEPGDHDELEAEEMANTIVSGGKISRKISGGASGSSGIAVSQQMERQLAHLQGGGRQMPEGLRNMMENGFGRDFSQVRLHTDGEAADMSSRIHAKAFTHGNDIYFNRGQFAPETAEGQRLVAHELTHVVQRTGKVGREELSDQLTCSENDYSFLTAFSVKTQQQNEQDPNKQRYQQIEEATEKNLQKTHESITVAFILSNDADDVGAFKSIDIEWSKKDSGSGDGILKNLLAFQPSSIEECISILEKSKMLGPLQNAIIAGHGNWDSILLSKESETQSLQDPVQFSIDHTSPYYHVTIDFFNKLDECLAYGRSINSQMKQSIYLEACLTNSHLHGNNTSRLNFKEILQNHISGDVHIWANSASSAYQDVDYDELGALRVTDNADPTILEDLYQGYELRSGRPRAIINTWLDPTQRDTQKLLDNVDGLINDFRSRRHRFEMDDDQYNRSVNYLNYVKSVILVIKRHNPNIDNISIDDGVTLINRLIMNFDTFISKNKENNSFNFTEEEIISIINKRFIDDISDNRLKRKIKNLNPSSYFYLSSNF